MIGVALDPVSVETSAPSDADKSSIDCVLQQYLTSAGTHFARHCFARLGDQLLNVATQRMSLGLNLAAQFIASEFCGLLAKL